MAKNKSRYSDGERKRDRKFQPHIKSSPCSFACGGPAFYEQYHTPYKKREKAEECAKYQAEKSLAEGDFDLAGNARPPHIGGKQVD